MPTKLHYHDYVSVLHGKVGKTMDLNKIRELISNAEQELFNGMFSEKTVRADLSARRNQKRDFYIQAFNKFIDDYRFVANTMQSSGESELAQRSTKCKEEASRLLDIVYEY